MILILGGSGMLGQEFVELFTKNKIEFLDPRSTEIDILNPKSLANFCKEHQIRKIINCVAYTQVDLAEIDPQTCFDLNIKAIENLILLDIPLINFSSDYVFNAPKTLEIPEDFERQPVNIYGQSKKSAEILLENSNLPFWNLRTSWLFGKHGNNFITTISQISKNLPSIKIINDQIGRPTSARDLAQYTLDNFIQNTPPIGHYHCQNTGIPVSWAQFAEYFLEKQNTNTLVIKISSEEFSKNSLPKIIAKRPRNSVLSNTKLNTPMPNWQQAVDVFLRDL